MSATVTVDRLRRLDALFAERVLGCKFRYDWTTGNMDWTSPEAKKVGGRVPLKPINQCKPGCGCGPDGPHADKTRDGESFEIAPYTRSLDAAWEGAAKIAWIELRGPYDPEEGAYSCCVGEKSSRCSHPAEALVLACLRAVGVSEEELA